MVSLTSVQQGDKVEYRPIGGAEENVAHSTGTIENVGQAEDGVSSPEKTLSVCILMYFAR